MSQPEDSPPQKNPPLVKEVKLEDIGDTVDVRKLLLGIFRHYLVIAVFIIGGAAGAWKIAESIKNTHKAQAVLIYNQVDPDILESDYEVLRFSLPSAVEMVTLPANLKAVRSILGLDMTSPELRELITVDLPILDSNLVNIIVEHENPSLAIDIANTLAHVAMKNSQNLARKQWHSAYLYFKEKGGEYDLKLDQQMQQIGDFRKDHKLLGTDLTGYMANQLLSDAELRLQQTNLEYTRLLVEYENLKREYSKIPDQIEKSMIQDSMLQGRISQIDTILLEARTKYAPENPKIKALEEQLDELKKRATETGIEEDTVILTEKNPVRAKLDLDLVTLQARLRSTLRIKEEMEKIVKNVEAEATESNQQQITLVELLNERKLTENRIATNEKDVQATEVKLHLGKGDIELYQEAEKAFPFEGSFLVDLLPLIGAMVGGIMGMFIAFLIEVADRRIRTEKQIELTYNLPCLSVFPELSFLTRWNSERKTRFHIRSLAERLELTGKEYQSLALISATSGEGKSFIAYYLAHYYIQKGIKTVVLELDPKKSNMFPKNNAPQKPLESYLQKGASWNEIISTVPLHHIRAESLDAIDAYLGTEEWAAFWCQLTDNYEQIILDIPGIADHEASISMAKFAEQSLYIIGSKKVKKHYVDSSLKILDIYQLRPLGIVLNRVLSTYIDNIRIKMLGRERKGLAQRMRKKSDKSGGSRIALS